MQPYTVQTGRRGPGFLAQGVASLGRLAGPRLESLADAAERLGSRPLFVALQRSLALALPLILTGAFASMLANLPLSAVRSGLDGIVGPGWRAICQAAVRDALKRDASARKWLAGYLMGAPEFKATPLSAVPSREFVLQVVGELHKSE